LISTGGRRVALVRLFQQSLRTLNIEGKVMTADITKLSSAYQAADSSFYAPKFEDPNFIPYMVRLCQENEIRVLVPTIDPELMLYANHIDKFKEVGTTVPISGPEAIRAGGDKVTTHEWLVEHGFPTPRQATVSQVMQAPDEWPFPFLVKQRHGSASIGVHIVRDQQELEVLTRDGEYIVQSIANGSEYTVDVYIDKQGNCRCAVPRLRIETRAGEINKGLTVRSEPLSSLAGRLCETLPGAFGVFNVQVFYDSELDKMAVIEFNPRFGGGYPLTHEAGAHYTQWLIEEIVRLPLSANADTWRDGVVMLRYEDAIFVSKDNVGL
jgi:carbamoyl-phosphate synthase large subunit